MRYLGVDVSSVYLEVFADGSLVQLPNTPDGALRLLGRMEHENIAILKSPSLQSSPRRGISCFALNLN